MITINQKVYFGWGARDRTWEWRNQNPLPYRLATPQQEKPPDSGHFVSYPLDKGRETRLDWARNNARHIVRMQALYFVHGLFEVSRCGFGGKSDFLRFFKLVFPAVDGGDATMHIHTGYQAFFYQGAGYGKRFLLIAKCAIDQIDIRHMLP